jgi:hypothetical protein
VYALGAELILESRMFPLPRLFLGCDNPEPGARPSIMH